MSESIWVIESQNSYGNYRRTRWAMLRGKAFPLRRDAIEEMEYLKTFRRGAYRAVEYIRKEEAINAR